MTMELLDALRAEGRSPEVPEDDDLYGWLVGSWDLEVLYYWADVSGQGIRGEAHFGWVLEGRAVQDVWIIPRIADRPGSLEKSSYGTTLRVWDPTLRAWRITWINPVTGARNELIGRRQGNDIVQIGALADGTPIRWRFTEIARDSFRWTGESLDTDGETWKIRGEFLARRSRH